ncbi:hypothetical protein CDLVIII_1322 [Clostridium sp. DL-VIII]|uniref:hypothetical protein n=1 Tax=Clostridium sp. DL-VIII TaxID=641107 RepID=UPI00023AF7B9|nr:hypothetical protein [Clostridium sp. DL-VIII]EHI98021.1 hypothetical protein CDLVIII_1322 [Clostridium sp. DL-VIII]
MLRQAILYSEDLRKKYVEAMCDDYFKFYSGCSYRSFDIEILKDDWNVIQRVSVNSEGKIIGFMSAEINRDSKNIDRFGIMNFTKNPNAVFAKDLIKFLRELKHSYNANKFEFAAYVGSEAEKMYTKFISKYGGNVIGRKRRSQKLADGEYYDTTIFEIMREDMNF